MAKNSKAKQAATARYFNRTYVRFGLVVIPSEMEKIRQAAAAAGQSVNAYILTATADRMEKEGFRLITTVSALKAQQRATEAPGEAQQPPPEE